MGMLAGYTRRLWADRALTTLAILFLAVGWRLLPHREGQQSAEESFSIDAYSTELRVPATLAPKGERTKISIEITARTKNRSVT